MNPQTRRTFLQTGLNGSLTASAIPLLSSYCCGMTAENQDNDSMTLGFSTYGMKSLRTENAIDHIAEIGFDAVEITVWPDWDAAPANMSGKRRRTITERISNHGLKLTSLMEHVTPAEKSAAQTANIRRLTEVFELAYDLKSAGPPLVQTVLGGGDWADKRNLLVDRIGAWLDIASDYGVPLAIKPHRGGVMSRPDEAVWLIHQLRMPTNLKIVYDYSHYAFRDMTLADTVQTALPHIGHVAVKDPVQEGSRVIFRLAGEAGTIEYSKLLKLLFEGGYRGDISCEVSGMVWKKKEYDPVAAAQTCYTALSKAFAVAGVPRPGR